jgi:hypothetical protein
MSEMRGPADLRRALADYVHALHGAYLDTLRARAAAPDVLPLGIAPFTVAVVAATGLHLVATRDDLPTPRAHEEPVTASLPPLEWTVRFLDVSVVPELAAVTTDAAADLLTVLGVTAPLYHLVVSLDGALSPHQAVHAGAGLAHTHLGHAQ